MDGQPGNVGPKELTRTDHASYMSAAAENAWPPRSFASARGTGYDWLLFGRVCI